MQINPFINSGSLTAFDHSASQPAAPVARKVQAYQPQIKEAVQAPKDTQESPSEQGYSAKGTLYNGSRGSALDLTV